MTFLYWLIFFVIISALSVIFLNKKESSNLNTQPIPADDKKPSWPTFYKFGMSETEQIVFKRILAVLPDHYVSVNMSVSRLLGIYVGENSADEWFGWVKKFEAMTVDFVVFDPWGDVKHVIELVDSQNKHSHKSIEEYQKDTDLLKARALKDVGIVPLRWDVNNIPTASEMAHFLIDLELDTSAVIV